MIPFRLKACREEGPRGNAITDVSQRRMCGLARLQGKPGLQVAELLLVRGLAQVVRHRTDDERSRQYESLMNAEGSGMGSKKGMHNKSKDPPVHYYNDVSLPSTSANQAKQYLPFFQRGKQKGIVEFVLSGARLKVRLSVAHLAAYALSSCVHSVFCRCILFGSWEASLSSSW